MNADEKAAFSKYINEFGPLRCLKGTRGQKTPDFLCEHDRKKLVLEVGGKEKGRSQFKGIDADRKYVFAEGVTLSEGKIPLHLAGMLMGGRPITRPCCR